MRLYCSQKSLVTFPFFTLLLISANSSAQTTKHLFNKKKKELQLPVPQAPDHKYIADYHKEFTARIFGSRKFTTYGLHDKGFPQNVLYRPNTPFNIGVGFNYRIIGINIGFNLPIINDTKENGRTRYLDIQSHLYGRKLTVDVYLQYYKGFYMPNTGILINNNNGQVYLRPDLRTLNFGLAAQYLLNGKRFSFRGAFLQNEVQLKSAGSPIIGGSISNISVRSDSSILPANLRYAGFYNDFDYNRSSVQNLGFNFGYGYTFVLPSQFFLTAAGSLGAGISYTHMSMKDGASLSGIGTDVNATFRIGMGYNSRRYFAGIHYLGTVSTSSTPIIYARQEFGAGNYRISLARRFTLKKKLLGFY